MALLVFRRFCVRLPHFTSTFLSESRRICSRTSGTHTSDPSSLSGSAGFGIETVDDDAWHVSSSLAYAWRECQSDPGRSFSAGSQTENIVDEDDTDHDDIDNMRIRGKLFYKIDRGSKEFEEYNFEFHRKKHLKTMREENREEARKKEAEKTKEDCREHKKKRDPTRETDFKTNPRASATKKERTPTFNQLTAPYHYPFCLDVYISKASVRASVIHRGTSKVVAVAHSISKDLKFDLGSTRSDTTCAAVGRILAQRALEDDIHDIIYTPRKGDRLEGKLQIVLQAIVDNGINLKVKLKQRKVKRTHLPATA